MIIERDRYLDDSSLWHVSLILQSRSIATHSLLTALTADERTAIADVMGQALDEIAALLREKRAASAEARS
jgi:hypothetical protein